MPGNDQQQQPQQQQGRPWVDLLDLGTKGINTFHSPLKIDPANLADGENVEFADGDLSNRSGCIEVYKDADNIPSVAIVQLITALDSQNNEYLCRYWGGNFEVWETINEEWIPVNGSVAFDDSTWTSKFGYKVWNNGFGAAWNLGADVLYLGNGTDQMAKWVIAKCVTTADLHNGDTTLHVDTTVQFPPLADAWHTTLSTQPILIAGVATTYSAEASTNFTIPSWSGATVPAGSVIFMPIQLVVDSSDGMTPVPGGNIMVSVGQRLYSAGMNTMETSVQFSGIAISGSGIPQPDPEYYKGTTGGINSGGLQEFADGDGPITALVDSLENLLVHKKNSIRKFYFQQSSTLNAQLPVISPVYTGDSSGAISQLHTTTVNLLAYYPTISQGISSLTPTFSYGNIYFQPQIISYPVQNIATDVSYAVGEVIYSDNKILWSVAEEGSDIPNLVLFYDLIAQGWGKERGWFANSWTKYNSDLLFADRGGFGIKKAFSENFDDSGQVILSYALSPQYSFGQVGKLKQNDMLYIQGLINKGGKLYVDIYYNANTGVWKKTYLIDSANPNITFVQDKLFGTDAFGSLPFVGGSGDSSTGFFQFILVNNEQVEWNTMQFKIYSKDIGTQWTVQAVSPSPSTVEALNSDSYLYPQ